MVKFALFDVGGVLISSTENAISKTLGELGLSRDQIDEAWNELINPKFGVGKISEDVFWAALRDSYGIRTISTSENLLSESFQQVIEVREDVLSIAKNLRVNEDLGISILSDTIEPHARVLRELSVYSHFSPVLLSHEIGLRKDNPVAFYYALREMNVMAEEVVFIDDRADNIVQAQEIGFHTILFTEPRQLEAELQAIMG